MASDYDDEENRKAFEKLSEIRNQQINASKGDPYNDDTPRSQPISKDEALNIDHNTPS